MAILLIPILSFVPMLIYAMVLWWLDRYEKEPLYLLVPALLWGGVPAIILSLILELILDVPILALAPNALAYDLLGSSLLAPLVEEGTKALALVLLFLFFRREIDSPLDGLIYGGMVGFGFAAVENFFYLVGAFAVGGLPGAVGLTLLRAGLFGLNHAMYTAFTGLGLALALESRSLALKGLLPVLGFALAIGAHAYHNTFATFWAYLEGDGSLVWAAVGDWVGVALLLVVAIWTRFLERKRIRDFVNGYVTTQTIPEAEVPLLISPLRRWWFRTQALLRGDARRWWQLGTYFHRISEAAFKWHRVQQGDEKSRIRLTAIEKELASLRKALILR
ncbi:MAG: PrsW family intramembrane metalloprotease [Anaerolineae bacterium]|nr:PrsW family intramembrane metalloprotease [Anaerolineae bacterium]